MSTLTEYFNRRSQTAAAPAPVVYDSEPDAVYIKAWQLSLEEWDAMKDLDRVWHRWNVTKAPGFKA
jgi:hypothetical protein